MPSEIRCPLREWDGSPGFIVDWRITGFFRAGLHADPSPALFDPKFSDNWETDWLKPWGGETGLGDNPQPLGIVPIEWLPVRCSEEAPNLNMPRLRRDYDILDTELNRVEFYDSQWYALAVIESDSEIEAELRFCVWDGTRLFFNGKLLFDEHSWHHDIIDLERRRITLRKGRNTFLFKNEREGLVARLIGADGNALGDGVVALTTAKPPPFKKVSGMAQVRRFALEHSVEMPFTGSTPEELSAWQEEFRKIYLRALGRTPPKN